MHEKPQLGGDEQSTILIDRLEREIQTKLAMFRQIFDETRKNAIVSCITIQQKRLLITTKKATKKPI